MKHCCKHLHRSLLRVGPPYNFIILILNVLIPGSGTILSSFMSVDFNDIQYYCGILQFFTSICIFGWVWSVYWGCIIFIKGFHYQRPSSEPKQRRQVYSIDLSSYEIRDPNQPPLPQEVSVRLSLNNASLNKSGHHL
ncbi:unnamed protein product [Moneuplotes crassus]|uniref:Uncharacterized protein n=1 Tax=Euplotes crassus TaxID=5936 RepID=A0AAD1Y2P4_EUPCR|nr:unnamed protein product [Moneuplotes crassus]